MTTIETVRPITIALVGHNGKTSALTALQRILHSNQVRFVPAATKIFYQENPRLKRGSSPRVKEFIQNIAQGLEDQAKRRGDKIVICPESVFDEAAHSHAFVSPEAGQALALRMRLNRYDKIFLFDPNGIADRGSSNRVLARQTIHEKGFIPLFETRQIEYQILTGSVKKRVSDIINFVEPYL